jgi:hypothetical protein
MNCRWYSPLALVLALAACSATDTMAPVVVGYTASVESPPPASGTAGSPVPVVFAITENESDGSTRPAAGKTFTVAITSGGGTVNGTASTTITTAVDGSASLVWVLGLTAGTQSLRGSLSSTEYRDLTIDVTPLPTLRVTNSTCAAGHCDSIAVLAFPDNQPRTPGGNWSILLGIVTGPEACFTLPPSATFTVSGPNSTTAITWTPAIPVSLGLVPAEGRLFADPSTPEFVAGGGAAWHVTLPGNQVAPDAACAP